MADESELAPRHQQFIDEYIATGNATQSYRTVYGKDVPYGTAATQASKLLKTPHIQAEIRAAQADLRKRNRVKTQRVINQLAKIAFGNIAEVVDFSDRDNPRLKDRKDIMADSWAAVQEVSRTQFGVKVKMKDSLAALDKLCRILGLYKEPDPIEILMARIPSDLREPVRAAMEKVLLESGSQPLPGSGEIAATAPGRPPTCDSVGGVPDAGRELAHDGKDLDAMFS